MSEWISVDDRLPYYDWVECVDVYSESQGRITDCSYFECNNWETYHGDKIDDVTHWMSAPELPK
jgi:hypothetical protein